VGNPYSTVVVISAPEVDIADDPHICEGASFSFFANSSTAINYLWPDDSEGTTFIASSTGEYWVRIEDTYGCIATDTSLLTVHQNPVIDLGNDTSICEAGAVLTLELDTLYSDYLWTLSGDDFWQHRLSYLNVEVSSERREFFLEVEDQWGCVGFDTIVVSFCGEFLIPNAFTPNGDGHNDTWRLDNLAFFPDVTVDIYDRRGERIFHSKSYETAWDGTDSKGHKMPMDSYYYVIDLQNGEKPFVGTVTLLR
jgi:gliding motility-associated-like protein